MTEGKWDPRIYNKCVRAYLCKETDPLRRNAWPFSSLCDILWKLWNQKTSPKQKCRTKTCQQRCQPFSWCYALLIQDLASVRFISAQCNISSLFTWKLHFHCEEMIAGMKGWEKGNVNLVIGLRVCTNTYTVTTKISKLIKKHSEKFWIHTVSWTEWYPHNYAEWRTPEN